NSSLLNDSTISRELVRKFTAWSTWLISRNGQTGEGLDKGRSVPLERVEEIARFAINAAVRNLRVWRTGGEPVSCAQESVQLIQDVAEACKAYRIKVKISRVAKEFGDCILQKYRQGPEADFNLVLRGLIDLCKTTCTMRHPNLGGGVLLNELSQSLHEIVGSEAKLITIAPWILDDLHHLADAISLHSYSAGTAQWKRYLHTISLLPARELEGVLRRPAHPKRHSVSQGNHSKWQSIVLEALRKSDRKALASSAQSIATRLWVNDGDQEAIISLFENLGTEYAASMDDSKGELVSLAANSVQASLFGIPIIHTARTWRA